MILSAHTYSPDDQTWSDSHTLSQQADHVAIFAFGDHTHFRNQTALHQLHTLNPDAHLIGCSTAGEILQGHVYDESLHAVRVEFEHSRLKSFSITLQDDISDRDTGKQLGQQICESEQPAMVYILAEGIRINGDYFLEGINTTIPSDVLIVGGFAGDDASFKETFVVHNSTVNSRSVVALAIYGDHISTVQSSAGGWNTFGPLRLVTRSKETTVYELDGQPALELYKKYLGELAADLPASGLRFPLAITTSPSQSSKEHIMRATLAINEEEQSISFGGNIPQGSTVWLMKANRESLISGAEDASQILIDRAPQDIPLLVLAVSCVSRRLVMGERTEEELDLLWESLPKGSILSGFYSFGEIAPGTTNPSRSVLHNQTMTLTMIYERTP